MRSLLRIVAWLVPLVPAGGALAQDCRPCDDAGVVECRRCAKDPCGVPDPSWLCSAPAGCETCAGTRVVECARCEARPERDLQAERAAIAAWLAQARQVDAFMEKDLLHARSPHFELTWDIRKIDLGKPHAAMHVYLERLEALMARVQADLGATDADFSSRTRVLLWSRGPDQEKASLKYTLQPSSTESKLMGAAPVVSIHYDKGHLHEEFELHQAVVHQVAHCLLSNAFDGIWPGNIRGGWLDEGLAHWYETELFGGVRHYCYVESDSIVYFEYGRWEPSVRVAVDRDQAPGLLSVTALNTVEMTPEQRMFAWSLVDYLQRAEPGTLGRIARAIKQRVPFKDAVAGALEVTPFELERDWRAWVQATYSPKKQRR